MKTSDINAEKTLLGSAIFYPNITQQAIRGIKSVMFSENKHSRIFDALENSMPSKSIVDAMSIFCSSKGWNINRSDIEELAQYASYVTYTEAKQSIIQTYQNRETNKILQEFQQRAQDIGVYTDYKELGKSLLEIEKLSSAREQKMEVLMNRRFSTSNQIDTVVPTITVNGATIASPGNIISITGPQKSGKSAVVCAIIAGTIPGAIGDFLGFDIVPNDEGKALVHIDTEQSEYDHHNAMLMAMRRANMKREPEWLHSFWLRGLSSLEKAEYTRIACEELAERHGGVYAIFVDGTADLLESPNDEQNSFGVVEQMEELATAFDCPVFNVVHLNPNSNKIRGHLGSQLLRKIESSILVEQNEDGISTISFNNLRNAGGVKDHRFYYDHRKGFHVSVDEHGAPSFTSYEDLMAS